MPYLSNFGMEFEKTIDIIEISTLEFRAIANFDANTKMKTLKFEIKNALFGYFWAGILKKLLLSYLKSKLSNLSNSKI